MVSFVVAFVTAVLSVLGSWYLFRWRTPDRSAEEVAGLRKQVADLQNQLFGFQQKFETFERERSEAQFFPLELTLNQTEQGNYIVFVTNGSDVEVRVETIRILRDRVQISETKAQPTNNWIIAPHDGKQIIWSPMPDPARTLRMIETNLAQSNVIPIEIVLVCCVNGVLRSFPFSKLVAVALGVDRHIQPFSR